MHPASPINPALMIADERQTPERLYLHLDVKLAVEKLPDDLRAYFATYTRAGGIKAVADATGIDIKDARRLHRRLRIALKLLGLGMARGP